MSSPTPESKEQQTQVWQSAAGFGLKLGASVFALALIIVVIGVSTKSPPIVVGVSTGLIVMIFAFVVIFKARASLKRDLESKRECSEPTK